MTYKIGYARVSTQDQNTSAQEDALRKAGCEEVFREKASGARNDRPELKAALSRLRKGDALVVWKTDRLARSLSHLLAVVEDLNARGIHFISLTEGFDTTTPGGKAFFSVCGAMAELERNLIRERTNAGLARAAAEGRKGGRPATPVATIEAARAMVLGGMSIRKAAKAVGVSPNSLGRAGIRRENPSDHNSHALSFATDFVTHLTPSSHYNGSGQKYIP